MKITNILNNGEPVKSGVGKNNKRWERFEVELDSGDTATLFGPVKVGTEVETFEDPSYGLQYRVKRVSLDKLEKQLEDQGAAIETLTKLVKWLVQQERNKVNSEATISGYDKAKAVADDIRKMTMAAGETISDEGPDILSELLDER